MLINTNVILLLIILISSLPLCLSSTLCYSGSGELEGFCYDRTLAEEEDVHIAVLVSIHEPRMGRFCGEISAEGFQNAVAVEWILKLLNGNGNKSLSFIPGVRLGYEIFDDCGLASRTTDSVMHLLTGTKQSDLLICTASCGAEDTPLLGILLLTSLESTLAAHDSITPNIPVVNARSPLPLGKLENNFYTTVPLLSTDIQVILDLMKLMRWNMIAVVYTEDALGRQLWSLFEPQLRKAGICGIYTSSLPVLDITDQVMEEKLEEFIVGLEQTQVQHVEEEKFGVLYLGDVVMFKEIQRYLKKERTESDLIYSLQWILPSVFAQNQQISSLVSTFEKDQDILSLSPATRHFSDFQNFLAETLFNSTYGNNVSKYYPWAGKYLSDVHGPTTPDISQIFSRYKQSGHVGSAVLGVLSYATFLKGLHKQKCGNNYGLCDQMKAALKSGVFELFQSLPVSLSSISRFLPEELQTEEEILFKQNMISYNDGEIVNITRFNKTFNSYEQVAFYENNTLHITSAESLQKKSICRDKCSVCTENHDIKFAYIPGDFLILGLFSLHEDGTSNEALTEDLYNCGKFRDISNTVVTVLSFIEGIKMLNLTTPGFSFGGIALDDCYNPLNVSYLLAELFSGKRVLRDPVTNSVIDFKNIIAVVGALSSKVTLIVADQMKALNIPMISYGASSAELDNKIRYPFFLRTVPSDKLQVEGLVSLLKTLEFTHVGAIYIDDAYGANGIRDFRILAEKNGICVEAEKKITEDFTDAQIDDMIEKLNKERVKVVLFYAIDTVAEKILSRLATRTDVHFTFVASEAWGTNKNLVTSSRGIASAGALVFVTTTTDVYIEDNFKLYLQNISTLTVTGNPWMSRFWEDIFQCDFYGSYDRRFSKTCSNTAKLNADQVNSLSTDQRSVHVRYAIYAIGKGFSKLCPKLSGCNELRNRTMASRFTEKIRDTELQSSNGENIRLFKEDGNGYLGFSIHNIQQLEQQGTVTYEYVEVGSYSVESKLSLQRENIRFYREGNPLIQVNSVAAECSPIYQQCQRICPVTTTPAAITTTMAPILSATHRTSTDEQTIIISVFGAVVGILLLIVVLLVISMCRQNSATKLVLQEKRESVANLGSQHSLDLYDEPKSLTGSINNLSNKGKWNRSFEHDDTAVSSSSGIGVNSRNVSNGTTNRLHVPIQYTDIQQMGNPQPHSTKYGSKNSVASYLAPANQGSGNSNIPKIEITRDDSSVPSGNTDTVNDFTSELPSRSYSADDITADMPSLNYMTAKDLQMEDEDVSVDKAPTPTDVPIYFDRNTNTARYIPMNNKDIEWENVQQENPRMDQQNTKRPKTLPGIGPRVVNNHSLPRTIQSAHVHSPAPHQPTMYLNPIGNTDHDYPSTSPHQMLNSPHNVFPVNPTYIYSDETGAKIPLFVTPKGEIVSPGHFVNLQVQSPMHEHQIANTMGFPSPVHNRSVPAHFQVANRRPVVQNQNRSMPQTSINMQNAQNDLSRSATAGRHEQYPGNVRFTQPQNVYNAQSNMYPHIFQNKQTGVYSNAGTKHDGLRSLPIASSSSKIPLQHQHLSNTLPKNMNPNELRTASTVLMPDVVSHEAIEREDENEVMI